MSNICTYATIEYYPNNFNNESINVAFIFHNATKGTLKFVEAKNKKRIVSFDDELDIVTYNKIIDSIKNYILSPFDNNLFDNGKNYQKSINPKYLETIKNYFLNEFRLSGITTIDTEDPEESEKELIQLTLYYDQEKENRPKEEDVVRILKKSIKQKFKMDSFEFEENCDVQNITEGENLRVDFKIGDFYIKVLNSKSEKYTQKINFAKAWCFNKNYFDRTNKQLAFALINKPENNVEETYLKILKQSGAKIFYLSDLNKLSEYIKNNEEYEKSSNY